MHTSKTSRKSLPPLGSLRCDNRHTENSLMSEYCKNVYMYAACMLNHCATVVQIVPLRRRGIKLNQPCQQNRTTVFAKAVSTRDLPNLWHKGPLAPATSKRRQCGRGIGKLPIDRACTRLRHLFNGNSATTWFTDERSCDETAPSLQPILSVCQLFAVDYKRKDDATREFLSQNILD